MSSDKNQRGWTMPCKGCAFRATYFVLSSDAQRDKVRRWKDDNCEELHEHLPIGDVIGRGIITGREREMVTA